MEGRELPVGWAMATVGELTDVGPKNECADETEVGFVPLQRLGVTYLSSHTHEPRVWKEVKKGYTQFQNGDVLLARITPSFENGKAGIARDLPNGLGAGSTEYIVFRPFADALDPRYLLAHFKTRSFLTSGEMVMTGAVGQQRVPKAFVLESQIPLAPLNEQRRIAAKLYSTIAAVEACRQRLDGVAAILKRFRQAVLAAATSGELTREWREDNPIDEDTGDNEVASLVEKWISSQLRGKAKIPAEPDLRCWTTEIPQSWHLGSVSMFAECLDSQRIPVKKDKRNAVQGTYPYYGANGIVDMVDEYIFDGELVLVTEDETFYGREKPIAYRSSGKCWVNNHAHVLRPEDAVAADYLCYCLMHYPVLPWLTGTTGRAKLTQGVLNSLPVAIPPRMEMEQIVSMVQELFSLADHLDVKLATARKIVDRFTPALLAKAFRGELVPQDPSDEPASVLLERIRAARQANAGAGKSSGRGRKKAAALPDQLPLDAAPAPPDLLSGLLRECGALSERALLAASELEAARFRRQLQIEIEAGRISEAMEEGERVLVSLGKLGIVSNIG
jgi:type I restriction enzyme S subunit